MEEVIVHIDRQTADTTVHVELTFQRPIAPAPPVSDPPLMSADMASLQAYETEVMSTQYPAEIDDEIAQILAWMSEIDFSSIDFDPLFSVPKPDAPISKEKYATFSSRRFKKADKLKGFHQDNCVICAENFKSNQKIPTLPCGHDFHWKCLGKWVTEHKSNCPFCKADVC